MFLSTQARILAIIALIELILSFVAAIRTMAVSWAIIAFGVGVVVMLIIIMDQDCTVVGGWVKFAFTTMFLVLSTVMAITLIVKGKGVTEEKKDDTSSKQ